MRVFKLYQSKDGSCLTNENGTTVEDFKSGEQFVLRSDYENIQRALTYAMRLISKWTGDPKVNLEKIERLKTGHES
jgi:hypothetical protein